jgi:hypothetical protein
LQELKSWQELCLCTWDTRIASPGEVINNVQLQQAPLLIILYLASFCATSTLVMGGFAAVYGKLCKFLAGNPYEKDEDVVLSRTFMIEFGSACLSIVVGIVWLTLLAVGQLDMTFLVDILYDSGGATMSEKLQLIMVKNLVHQHFFCRQIL